MKYRKVIMYFIVLYGKTKKCQIHQTMTCVNNQLFLGAIYLCLLHALVDIIETAALIKLINKDLLLGFLILHVLLVPEKIGCHQDRLKEEWFLPFPDFPWQSVRQ